MHRTSKPRIAIALAIVVAILIPRAGIELRIALERLIDPPPVKADRIGASGRSPQEAPIANEGGAARTMPNDPAVQLAAIDSRDLNAVRRLAARFPRDSLLRVRIVAADLPACPLNRPDLGWPPVVIQRPGQPAPRPEDARTLENDAAEGERIDPGNAFFPSFRAYALFVQRRDYDAAEALVQAGRADRWEDYTDRRDLGMSRLRAADVGPPDALERVGMDGLAFADEFSCITPLRNMAQVAVCSAIDLETVHRSDRALLIRMALARYGELMRRDAHAVVAALVGTFIEETANDESPIRAAGGAAQAAHRRSGRLHRATVVSRLQTSGQPDLAAGFAAGKAASDRASSLISAEVRRAQSGVDDLARIPKLQNAVYAVLLGIAWLAAPFGLAKARGSRSRARARLLVGAGIAFAALVGWRALGRVIAMKCGADPDYLQWDTLAPAVVVGSLGLIVPLVCLIVAVVLRLRTQSAFSQCVRGAARDTLAAAGAVLAILLWMLATLDGIMVQHMSGCASHEGRALAAEMGSAWPQTVAPKF